MHNSFSARTKTERERSKNTNVIITFRIYLPAVPVYVAGTEPSKKNKPHVCPQLKWHFFCGFLSTLVCFPFLSFPSLPGENIIHREKLIFQKESHRIHQLGPASKSALKKSPGIKTRSWAGKRPKLPKKRAPVATEEGNLQTFLQKRGGGSAVSRRSFWSYNYS